MPKLISYDLKKFLCTFLICTIFFNLFYFIDISYIKANEGLSINMAQAQTEMASKNLNYAQSSISNDIVNVKLSWEKPKSNTYSAGDIYCDGLYEAGKGALFKFEKYSIFIFSSKTNETKLIKQINNFDTNFTELQFKKPDNETISYLINVRTDYKYDNYLTCGADNVKNYCKNTSTSKYCQGTEIPGNDGNNSNPKISSNPKLQILIDKNGNINIGNNYSNYNPIIKGVANWDESKKSYLINLSWEKNPQAPNEPDLTPKYKLIRKTTSQWSGLTQGDIKNYLDNISKEYIQNRGINNSLNVSYAVYAYYSGIDKQNSISNTINFKLAIDENGNPVNNNIEGESGSSPSASDIQNAVDIGEIGPTDYSSSQCKTKWCTGDSGKMPYVYICEALCWISDTFMNLVKWTFDFLKSAISTESKNYVKPSFSPKQETGGTSNNTDINTPEIPSGIIAPEPYINGTNIPT